jgi:hypothetical protein
VLTDLRGQMERLGAMIFDGHGLSRAGVTLI